MDGDESSSEAGLRLGPAGRLLRCTGTPKQHIKRFGCCENYEPAPETLNLMTMETNTYQQINQSTDAVCIEMDLLNVGSEPVGMRCPYCTEDIMTRATYSNTVLTHVVALILGILFWWMCCCFVPYFVKRWKNVEHYCPNCRRFLGVYARKSWIGK